MNGTSTCPNCGEATAAHCRANGQRTSPTCDMWSCTSCFTYGTAIKTVVDKRRRTVAE